MEYRKTNTGKEYSVQPGKYIYTCNGTGILIRVSKLTPFYDVAAAVTLS